MVRSSDALGMSRMATVLLGTTMLTVLPVAAIAQTSTDDVSGAGGAGARMQRPGDRGDQRGRPGRGSGEPRGERSRSRDAVAIPAEQPEPPAAGPIAPGQIAISSITVNGALRLEPQTVLSYTQLRIGQPYSQAAADQALKDLFATELFADVQIRNDGGAVVIDVKENPVVNRIILEGNKHIKEDKITPEIKVAPRQIFTRSKVRADVARILELYKRQGRFAATVEPKMVLLDQNRVDIVFEISEGAKSKVRRINIIGNTKFSDGDLRGVMVTKEAKLTRLLSSGTTYDPDRLAFDQQKLRQFYLTQGYADFRVVSAVAELTRDKKDFIITYVVEEGQRYKFGDVKVESQLRDFSSEALTKQLPMKAGDWYNAKLVEDTIDKLNETAGAFGYAFADARPQYNRDKDKLTMGVTFVIGEAPRVYVERIDVNGNTLTQDKVVRREFRLAEGDAFNSVQVKRSTNRIKSLGYFQEKFEVEQKPGSAADRIILEANVEEKPTGQLQLSAGFSSIESFILQASIEQNNFRGRGQTIGLSGSLSRYTKSIEASFTEPYLFDRNVSLGVDLYRRDLNSFNYGLDANRNTIYSQATTGFQIRTGVPLTEFITAVARYTLNYDDITLDKNTYYSFRENPNLLQCDPIIAGRYLCEALGKRLSSIIGGSLIFDTLDNRARPTRGRLITVGVDYAGLGGDVRYGRITGKASQYYNIGHGFVFSLSAEGGLIHAFGNNGANTAAGIDSVRLTDRFFLGNPQIRGFDIRGVGPRILRVPIDENGVITSNKRKDLLADDALGGKYYYLGRAELELPLGSGARELGLRPSIFADVGAVFGVRRPQIFDKPTYQYSLTCTTGTTTTTTSVVSGNGKLGGTKPASCTGANDAYGLIQGFVEQFAGNTPKPRLSVGVGVNWNSPFGPFRIDIARALLKSPGDEPKLFTFNVGTQF